MVAVHLCGRNGIFVSIKARAAIMRVPLRTLVAEGPFCDRVLHAMTDQSGENGFRLVPKRFSGAFNE